MRKNFNNLSKDDLIKYIEELRKQINNEKYGLYFDRKIEPENVVEQSKLSIPLLNHIPELDVINGVEDNLLIEGDNLHALIALNLINPVEGLVDVIYIDPPYNTGARDWKYNNDYVDSEDTFRHTKWLNMMEKRLVLAKNLLKEDGIIVVAIDHYELFQLGMLMNNIFGEDNKIGVVTVVHKPEGRNQEKFFGTSTEYALFYSKNKENVEFNKVVLSDDKKKEFDREDNVGLYRLNPFISKNRGQGGIDTSTREYRPEFWYSIFVSKDCSVISLEEFTDSIEILPISSTRIERTWRTKKETFLERLKNNLIIAENINGTIQIFEKYYENEIIKTHWVDKKYHATFHGTKLLNDILGSSKFNFPKSLYLIEDILKLTAKRNAIILDFFAGSGTTGHAVLNLNNDGGNRKFILVTNNEGNIMSDVCHPRIKTVITGLREDGTEYSDGVKENVRFFKTEFINKGVSKDQIKYDLIEKIYSLIGLLEKTLDKIITEKSFSIYTNTSKNKVTAIYNDYYEKESFNNMLDKIIDNNVKDNVVYYFSLDNNVDETLQRLVKDKLPKAIVKPIPSKIYEIYKKIAEDLRRDY